MTEPRWNLAGEAAALIVVDMQNGFLRPDGFFAKGGLDWRRCAATIDPNRRVVAAARAARLPVVFTRYTLKPDYSDAGLLAEWRPHLKSLGAMVQGTCDWQICEELTPQPGDLIVDKTRYSAFHGTRLAETLHDMGVTMVVVTGVTTNMCVESTVRDAFTLDFKVVVLEDCVGAPSDIMQQGPLQSFRYGFGDVIASGVWIQSLSHSMLPSTHQIEGRLRSDRAG
jgi:ureidoacrylate peracid hydrolase